MPFYQLKVVTPQGTVYAEEVRHARIPAENGSVGVLAHHAPFVTTSAGGALEVDEKSGKRQIFRVGSGFFTVAHNQAFLLTDSFQTEPSSDPLR